MTIEEKARAYDEALERVNSKWHYKNQPCFVDVAEIFPELAESEDERIKKDVKRAISVALDYSYFDEETANNCLAWLEKQKPIQTPQWMIDFLDNYRGKIGVALDWEERRNIEGRILAIHDWLQGNPNIEKKPTEWTKADAFYTNALIDVVKNGGSIRAELRREFVDWIESIKQRMEKQQ